VDASVQTARPGGRELLASAGSSLRLDLAAAEAIHRLELAGVPALLLKGRSLARWLYPHSAERSYRDCDLLVPAARSEFAADTLTRIGYERAFDERGMPSWCQEHAGTWFRGRDGTTIDLHRTLPGVSVPDDQAWRVLSTNAETMSVGGSTVPALALPARALHVALHAAQHGAEWAEPITDLRRALAAGDDRLWRRSAELAVELGAVEAFAAGLHLLSAGDALAERLRLPSGWSIDTELRASSAPATALAVEQLVSAGSFGKRVTIVWQKLLPPPRFIRHWDPRAAQSRTALVRAYARRPLWLLRVTPQSVGAWRRARKAVRGASRAGGSGKAAR
jgi:hypothetical protein